ncbi:MAG TPA: thioredoxin domain-containing protein [Gammaproteobacteria bacterium]|nr:thioredoxin domain-containing protein [Gammaproteobacteria bacterium]
MSTPANRLAGETSPYLLQHAHNPVDWHPWDAQTLELARREGRPILLSIGYSACHWCHVMAHECFEDPQIAAQMNGLFVNIKVDREERPDLDRIYQLAHQMITQRNGGWPLTMFLSPEDQTPFFGGTYFPPTPRHGLPGFPELLQRVAGYWDEHKDEIRQHADAVREAFATIWEAPAGGARDTSPLDREPLDGARRELGKAFDKEHGGFGDAPKFPHPPNLVRLLRHWRGTALGESPDLEALYMATSTLQQMAEGGIYDQLGGGFCRYAVDEHWMIPHFEKMLYDNAQLLPLYAHAWSVTNENLFRRIAAETAGWVMREMQSPEGGYWSSLDADSEGEEGQFYSWTRKDIERLLAPGEFAVVSAVYGLDRAPNFEGRWHLHTFVSPDQFAASSGLDGGEVEARLRSAREKLFAARESRVRPGRDEKVLAAWNGLMIRGMCIAARILGDAALADSAARAMEFVRREMLVDGRLLATWKDGRARHAAYLDDYAYLLDAALEMLQLRWNAADLAFATTLADVLLAHFEDPTGGGFLFTADDHERLIERPRPLADDAMPAGNGVAALALNRLGCLLGEPRYLAAAERAVRSALPVIRRVPFAHCALLDALEEQLDPPEIVIVRGAPKRAADWARTARLVFAPRRLVFEIPADAAELPPALAEKASPETGARAWICRGTTCLPPVDTLATLTTTLKG